MTRPSFLQSVHHCFVGANHVWWIDKVICNDASFIFIFAREWIDMVILMARPLFWALCENTCLCFHFPSVCYVVFGRRPVLFTDVFCSAFAGNLGEVLSISIFVVALIAYHIVGSMLGALQFVTVRLIGPVVMKWGLFCVFIAQPAMVCTLFLLVFKLCGSWFSMAAAILAIYYLYYYQGMICLLYCLYQYYIFQTSSNSLLICIIYRCKYKDWRWTLQIISVDIDYQNSCPQNKEGLFEGNLSFLAGVSMRGIHAQDGSATVCEKSENTRVWQ